MSIKVKKFISRFPSRLISTFIHPHRFRFSTLTNATPYYEEIPNVSNGPVRILDVPEWYERNMKKGVTKPRDAHVLTLAELKETDHMRMYFEGRFINFSGHALDFPSFHDLMNIANSTFILQSIYSIENNECGTNLKSYLKSQGYKSVFTQCSIQSTCFFARSDNNNNDHSSNAAFTTAHSVSECIGSRCDAIYDNTSPYIAGKLREIKILHCGGLTMLDFAKISYIDFVNDIALLTVPWKWSYSIPIAAAEYQRNPAVSLCAGYRNETGDVIGVDGDMLQTIKAKDVNNVYGDLGELSFLSISQDYVNERIGEGKPHPVIAGSQTEKVLDFNEEKNSGKIEVYLDILKGQSGAPKVDRQGASAIITTNYATTITKEAKEALKQVEMLF